MRSGSSTSAGHLSGNCGMAAASGSGAMPVRPSASGLQSQFHAPSGLPPRPPSTAMLPPRSFTTSAGSEQFAPWSQGAGASTPTASSWADRQMAGPSNASLFQPESRVSLVSFLNPEETQMLSSVRHTADGQSAGASQLESRLSTLDRDMDLVASNLALMGYVNVKVEPQ